MLHDFEQARKLEAIIRKLESEKFEVCFLGNSSLKFCRRFLQVEKQFKKKWKPDTLCFIGIGNEKSQKLVLSGTVIFTSY